MIKITIGDDKYKIPNNFQELSIGKYQELNGVDDTDKINMITEYISILTGLDLKTIKKINLVDLKKLTSSFNFHLSNDHDVIHNVGIKGDIYKLDDNLNDMRLDMFIDLEEMTKDKDLVIENLHLIMAILYRPAIKKMFKRNLKIEPYDSGSVKERADFFKENLMMDKIIGALFFFINLSLTYIVDLADSLELQKVKEEKTYN